MEIIFKSKDREYKAQADDIEDIFDAVRDGLVAMSFTKETAKQFVKEMQDEE